MHLTAAIFRAVEVRTPIVIAANTGFSAWIDGSGRLLARGPRRATATLRARVFPDGRASPWLAWGSLPAGACVAVAVCIMTFGRRRKSPGVENLPAISRSSRSGLLEDGR
jgi:apolipoprotein N-acyltransferase